MYKCYRVVSGWAVQMLHAGFRLECTIATGWCQAGIYKCYRVVSGWDVLMPHDGVRLGCTNATG